MDRPMIVKNVGIMHLTRQHMAPGQPGGQPAQAAGQPVQAPGQPGGQPAQPAGLHAQRVAQPVVPAVPGALRFPGNPIII